MPAKQGGNMGQDYQQVLDFWFGETSGGWGTKSDMARWFMSSSKQLDSEMAEHFGHLLPKLAAGEYRNWIVAPLSGLAAVVALDQFPRNIHRGTAEAFSFDPLALESSLRLIESGAEAELAPVQRLFLYMPLEHSEDLAMQEMSVHKFRQLAEEAPPEHKQSALDNLGYAESHRDLIVRFGRFPHRNGVLGRASTPEESAYLSGGGETFGQSPPATTPSGAIESH